MPSIQRYAEEVQEFCELVQDFQNKTPRELNWKIEQLACSYKALFDRFCPYQIGDRVQLIATPVITQTVNNGWWGYRHLLVKGAKATVKERDYRSTSQEFVFQLEFDDDNSWVDHKGAVHPSSEKGLFLFSENMMSLAFKR